MSKEKKRNIKLKGDLDFGDLDDLESDMDFGMDLDDSPDREPSRSRVLKELSKEAGQGFLDRLVKKTTKDALPDQYSASYYDAMDLYSFANDVVDKNKEKLNKTVFKLGKEVKRVLPFKLSLLDKYLEAQQANFESFKQQAEEDVRNAGIQSELTAIFDKQLEVQKAFEARRDAQSEIDKKEQLSQVKLSNDLFTNIDGNIARQTAFTVDIGQKFYRKSLELQFKSYFVQADMLRTMRDHYKAFAIQFTNIEKNTSLPEFVKLKNTERLQDILRTQATQSVYNQLFEKSKFVAGMKKRLSGFVDEKVGDLTNTVDNFTDMIGNISGGAEMTGSSPAMLLASMASSMFGETIGDKLSAKISPKIKDKFKDNKTINKGANYLSMLSNSPASLVQVLRQKAGRKEAELEDESSPGRWVGSKVAKGLGGLLDIASPTKVDASVKQLGYLDHNQPAIFDNKVHRSISEVIPLYLARILKENTDLTNMFYQANQTNVKHPNSGLLVYDFQNRKLTSEGSLKSSIEKGVFAQKSTTTRSKSVSMSILSEASKSVKDSEMNAIQKKQTQKALQGSKSEKLLTNYIEQAKKHLGSDISYESLITDYQKNETLSGIVEKTPHLKELLDVLRTNKPKALPSINTRMKDLTNVYPIEGVKRLFSEASKLTRASTPHMVSDPVATVFSKAFSTYILMTGRDVDAESVLTKRAFAYLKEDSLNDKVENSLVVLLDDVKRIRNTDDTMLQSSLDLLFGMMCFSLKENINVDPSVYQTLSDLYPNMVSKGQLSIENIAEGKLVDHDDSSYVGFEKLKDITKTSQVDVLDKRREITYDNFIDRANKIASEGLKSAAAALKETKGNPVAVAELLLKSARNFKSSVNDKLKTNFNKIDKLFIAGITGLSKFSDDFVQKGVPIGIDKIGASIRAIDERIQLLQRDLSERMAEMDKIGTEISEAVNSPISKNRIKQLDKAYTSYVEAEITALRKVRDVLDRQLKELMRIKSSPARPHGELILQFRNTFSDTLMGLRTVLKELEARGKSLDVTKL